ncbi:hypothetical protein C8035_v011395 [Colletotrichum spinosum]|uniref:Uncharacterized protein n=1 Tax=Colletotrichum spinosum TaxID=1347390 RepID=A0A4R8Q7X3_9PEZI|nr:hypothetical protein C8035_v011395 [Colletotrichum spinosum]
MPLSLTVRPSEYSKLEQNQLEVEKSIEGNTGHARCLQQYENRQQPTFTTGRLAFLLALLATVVTIFDYATRGRIEASPPAPIEPPYRYDEVDPRVRRCGHTPAEARFRGCIFSPVSFAWLPPSCIDAELDDEIRAHPDWVLFADLNKTRTKSEDEWAADESDTWLTNRAHMLHCVYSWRRMHRDLVAGRELHTGLGVRHTKHCSEIIMWQRDPDEIVTGARVIYPGC